MEPGLPALDFDAAAVAKKLAEPVEYAEVKFRPVGGGKSAAYLAADRVVHSELEAVEPTCGLPLWRLAPIPTPARAVANEIFGFNKWACEISEAPEDRRGGAKPRTP